MAFFKFLTMAAFATVLLLDLAAQADACRCLIRSLCQQFETADAVVRATALSRTGPVDNRITYILDPETIYKGVGLVNPGQEISVVTNSRGASCGIHLNLFEERAEEYVIGLNHISDGSFSASTCDLVRRWDSLTEEEIRSLEAGCEEEDPCYGLCGEFQECLQYDDNLADPYYCSDVCDPNPCVDGRPCTLVFLGPCERGQCPAEAHCY